MVKFVLKNNYFEFNSKVKQQISGIAVGTKIAPPYACLFMDEVVTSFLEMQEMKTLVQFRYIDDVFFIWTQGQEKLDSFPEKFDRCKSYVKFTYQSSKTSIPFLDLKVSLSNWDFPTDLHQIHRQAPVFTLDIVSS